MTIPSLIMVRLHLVNVTQLADHKGNHKNIIFSRPTPWKPFLRSFFSHNSIGFAVLTSDALTRFHSEQFAFYHGANFIRSDGDIIIIQEWSILNVSKFCLEGFQYGTFLRFWEWTWK